MNRQRRNLHGLWLTLMLAGPMLSPLWAEEERDPRWQLCPTPRLISAQEQQALSDIPPGLTHGYADRISAEADGLMLLHGHVQLEQQNLRLLSGEAEYDRQNDQIWLRHGVSLYQQGQLIEGEEAYYRPQQQSGRFEQANFFLSEQHIFARADLIRIDDPQHLEFRQLQYTTCPPAKQDWLLSAQRLKLDQASNTGEAYHATLRFKGVPFMYSPYLNFPLAGRKSGLLPPTFGSSDKNGDDLSLPIYWNIAPNQDATITPRYLSKRGNMLDGEYRFLGASQSGQLNAARLFGDEQYDDQDRYELSLRHRSRPVPGWSTHLLYQQVSDDDYYLDYLGSPGRAQNVTQLERRFDLNYSDRHWRFLARMQEYQTLSGTAPYQRWPQLQLHGNSPRHYMRPQYSLASEAVSFRHLTRVPTGDRLDIKPSVSIAMGGAAWFLTPTVAWRHTEYHLQDHFAEEQQVRSLPISSLDSGLFFDRPFRLFDQAYTQTLEPRLYYLRVPYREQDDLPNFDTSAAAFSFASLFRDNRFVGADRQGDANQLTVALSSRILEDASGRERASIAIAQANYLEEQRVTLRRNQPASDRPRSDIIGELGISPIDSLSLRMTEQWNPETGEAERFTAGLRYSPDKQRQIHASYRFYRPSTLNQDEQRQADITVLWPLTRQWRILAIHNRDLIEERTLENIIGLEYESCCWKLRLINRADRAHVDEAANRSTFLSLELKGLGSMGRSLEQSIGRDTLDYD